MRIAYIPGPGNISRTYHHWRNGEDDPSIPIKAYSSMFFDMCADIEAEWLVLQRSGIAGPLSSDEMAAFYGICVKPYSGAGSYWASLLDFTARCIQRIRTFRADTVIVGGDFFMPALPLLKLMTGAEIFLSIHNTYWPKGTAPSRKKRALLAFYGMFMRMSVSGAVAVSEECARQYRSIVGSDADVRVFRTYVKDAAFASPPALAPDGFSLIYVGRVVRNKGVFDLITAYERVASENPTATLVFAGDGPDLGELKKRAAESVYASGIACAGRLDGDQINKLLRESSILVCPTRNDFEEGFATVCAEAVAQGVPCVVSTAVPAAESLEGSCVVFPANDADALGEALMMLSRSKEELNKLRETARFVRTRLQDRSQNWGAMLKSLIATGAQESHRTESGQADREGQRESAEL